MKSVLISIRPKWVQKIASGEKTIEVRKTALKEVPFKAYIYCTKGKDGYEWLYRVDNNGYGKARSWHGKVIGEFICDKVDAYNFHEGLTEFNSMGLPSRIYGSYLIFADDYKSMCLSYDEVKSYGNRKIIYGWHISDLKIYDKPKELSEFRTPKNPHRIGNSHSWILDGYQKITRPPQSWCYVEELKK